MKKALFLTVLAAVVSAQWDIEAEAEMIVEEPKTATVEENYIEEGPVYENGPGCDIKILEDTHELWYELLYGVI